MWRPDLRRECLAAVSGLEELHVLNVNRVFLNGIGGDVRVIERALSQVAVFAALRPARAGVVADEDATVIVFDNGVDTIAVGAGYRNTNLAPQAGRQALVLR